MAACKSNVFCLLLFFVSSVKQKQMLKSAVNWGYPGVLQQVPGGIGYIAIILAE